MNGNQWLKETENIDIPEHVAEAGVAAVLKAGGVAHGSAKYFVVQGSDGKLLGQLMITLEWSDWRATWCWWIQSVYVRPESRGQGLFRKLYEHVKDRARKEGAAGLRLYADDHNKNAHGTYERLGMTSHYKVYEDMFTSY